MSQQHHLWKVCLPEWMLDIRLRKYIVHPYVNVLEDAQEEMHFMATCESHPAL